MTRLGSKKRISIFLVVTVLLLTACSAQMELRVDEQANQQEDSTTLNLDVGIGNSDSSNQPEDTQKSEDASTQNQPMSISSNGLLILIGIALFVMVGLLIGIIRARGIGYDSSDSIG